MRALVICCLMFGLVGQAHALSCAPPNLAESFNYFQSSSSVYQIAVGTMKTDLASLPAFKDGTPRKTTARFQGRFLSKKGLGSQKTGKVTVRSTCAASWCGGFANFDKPTIFFLRKSGSSYTLISSPCPDSAITPYTKARIELLQRCMTRGGCTEKEINALNF